MFDLRFSKDFTYIIAGPSRSGKTVHVINILQNQDELFKSGKITNAHYFFKEWQPSFETLKKEKIIKEWHNFLPNLQFVKDISQPYQENGGSLVIIDDFGQNLTRDIVELFTVLSHHSNLSVILLLQSLFNKNPLYREIQLSAEYISVFKNNRDKSQILHFAKQMFPTNTKFLVEAYRIATLNPYTYMFFDMTQKIPDILRIRSNILPSESPMKVWMEKQCGI